MHKYPTYICDGSVRAYTENSVNTDADLWCWIRDGGGIARNTGYWDQRITPAENRRAFAYLDRTGDAPSIDRVAECIAQSMPWFGIETDSDLWEWLGRYEAGQARQVVDDYTRYLRSAPTADEIEPPAPRVPSGVSDLAGEVVRACARRDCRNYPIVKAVVRLADGAQVWTTVPRTAEAQMRERYPDLPIRRSIIGQRCTFRALVTPCPEDPTYGFCYRPRKWEWR